MKRDDHSFTTLKDNLKDVTINYHFDPDMLTVVDTDASNYAVGAILQQEQNGSFQPVMFASKKFSLTEQKRSTREREAYAVVWPKTWLT